MRGRLVLLAVLLLPGAARAQAVELQVAPGRLTLSSGQRAVVTVSAFDRAGNIVTTPAVKWVSTDPGVVVVSADSAHPDVATVVGVAAGVTTVEAHVGLLTSAMAVQTLGEGETVQASPQAVAPTTGTHVDDRSAAIRTSYDEANAHVAADRPDSAIVHYRRFLSQADDPASKDVKGVDVMRETALFNLATQFFRKRQWDSAAKYFTRLRQLRPGDAAVANRLAGVMEATGRPAEAAALYDSALAHRDSLSSRELFMTGAGLLRAKHFRQAASALEASLATNACHHDALSDLAASLNGIAQESEGGAASGGRAGGRGRGAGVAQRRRLGDSLVSIGRRLIDIAPLSRGGQRVLANGYQHLGLQDSARAALERVRAMTIEVRVESFVPLPRRANATGTVTNLTDRPVQAPALEFQFVNGQCGVVTSANVAAQVLAPGASAPFKLSGMGVGITGWKYKVGG